jgi:hypothetical protein
MRVHYGSVLAATYAQQRVNTSLKKSWTLGMRTEKADRVRSASQKSDIDTSYFQQTCAVYSQHTSLAPDGHKMNVLSALTSAQTSTHRSRCQRSHVACVRVLRAHAAATHE